MSSASIDRKRARELVERIALENGFVSESVMESIPQDARLQIEKALLAKDKKIGAAVLTYVYPRMRTDDSVRNC